MPKHKRPTECKECGKPATARRPISRFGRCYRCAEKAAATAAREMKAKSGPTWDRYIAAMTRIYGGEHAHGAVPMVNADQDAAAL